MNWPSWGFPFIWGIGVTYARFRHGIDTNN